MAASDLDAIAGFLASIGIPLEARGLDASTFLPGVTVEGGAIVYDPARLTWPGDLLHEAGHIALTSPGARHTLSGRIAPELQELHADEPEVTAWAFAAIMAIGLHPSVLFHPGGYHGKSEGLIFTYMNGVCPGVGGLVAAGMVLTPAQAAAAGLRPYPSMLRWLRE